MSPLLLGCVSLAGGLGAGIRWAVDRLVSGALGTAYPWGTQLINVTGSFALGLVTGSVAAAVTVPAWAVVVEVGFLGGYTTFSTASLESVRLLEAGRTSQALAAGLGTALLAVAAAAAGLGLGILDPW